MDLGISEVKAMKLAENWQFMSLNYDFSGDNFQQYFNSEELPLHSSSKLLKTVRRNRHLVQGFKNPHSHSIISSTIYFNTSNKVFPQKVYLLFIHPAATNRVKHL